MQACLLALSEQLSCLCSSDLGVVVVTAWVARGARGEPGPSESAIEILALRVPGDAVTCSSLQQPQMLRTHFGSPGSEGEKRGGGARKGDYIGQRLGLPLGKREPQGESALGEVYTCRGGRVRGRRAGGQEGRSREARAACGRRHGLADAGAGRRRAREKVPGDSSPAGGLKLLRLARRSRVPRV